MKIWLNSVFFLNFWLLGLVLPAFAEGPRPLPLDSLELQPGFEIEVYARVPQARGMVLSDSGILFVGSYGLGRVHAVVDVDKDGKSDHVVMVAKNIHFPIGVTMHKGALYVSALGRILAYPNIESTLLSSPKPFLVTDKIHDDRHHGAKFIRMGPDEKLYVPIGAPCNICNKDDEGYAQILRMDPDGKNIEVVARGVRNTVGFDWHPETKELWFTDNGRDWLGDDLPPDELNRLSKDGEHFGYPFCHGEAIKDPDFGAQRSCDEFTPAAQALGPHVAALGMRFYTGEMFPEDYRGQIFIAEHGSWNRTKKIGYRVTLVRLEGNNAVSYEPFVSGWKQGERVWGRPADVLVMPDGALLISDDHASAVYRVTYKG